MVEVCESTTGQILLPVSFKARPSSSRLDRIDRNMIKTVIWSYLGQFLSDLNILELVLTVLVVGLKRAQEYPDQTRIDWNRINFLFWSYLCQFPSDLDVLGLILIGTGRCKISVDYPCYCLYTGLFILRQSPRKTPGECIHTCVCCLVQHRCYDRSVTLS